jgi:hypothetical protein
LDAKLLLRTKDGLHITLVPLFVETQNLTGLIYNCLAFVVVKARVCRIIIGFHNVSKSVDHQTRYGLNMNKIFLERFIISVGVSDVSAQFPASRR